MQYDLKHKEAFGYLVNFEILYSLPEMMLASYFIDVSTCVLLYHV